MDDYAPAWLEYKRARNEIALLFFLCVPLSAVSTLMSIRPDHQWLWQALGPLLSLLWFVAFVMMYVRLRRWPCPRCGKRFFSHCERRGIWLSSKRCWHCDLPKYSSGRAEGFVA